MELAPSVIYNLELDRVRLRAIWARQRRDGDEPGTERTRGELAKIESTLAQLRSEATSPPRDSHKRFRQGVRRDPALARRARRNLDPEVRMRAILILLAVTAIGCGDKRTAVYEAAARRVNPILLALQPTREKFRLAHPQGSDSKFYDEQPAVVSNAIAACNDARTLFAELGRAEFGETSDLSEFDVGLAARELAIPWKSCPSQEDRNHTRYLCWRTCLGMWAVLANEAEHLRRCAREVGVEIVSLGATDAPLKRCPRFSE